MSQEENNKTLIRRYVDFLNQNNLPSEEFISPEFIYHDPGLPDIKDLAGVRQFITACIEAFPDQVSTIEDIVAEGDKIVCRYSWRGTHKRDFMGIPATGKPATLTTISIYRIVNGKVAEEWNSASPLNSSAH